MYEPWRVGEQWGFEIQVGPYADTVIQIEEFSMKDDDSVDLSFHIIKKADQLHEDDYKKEEFNTLIGQIFNHILSEAIKQYEGDPSE